MESAHRLAGASTEVLVADNGLDPGVRGRVHAAGAIIVSMGVNAGFGRAVNAAAARASGDVLVVLNDDVTPEPGFLDALLAPLASGADVAAGVLLHEHDPSVIEAAGVVIDSTLIGYEHLHGEPVAVLDQSPADPFGPTGGAAAYTMDAFRSAGGFDEGLFAYWEDVDLAVRMRALGARCALAPDARALHARSATLGDGSLAKTRLVADSRGYMLRKYGLLRAPALAPRVLGTELAVSIALAARHRSADPLRARIRGYRRCTTTHQRPEAAAVSVGGAESVRRRLSRGRRARGGFARP